MCDFWNVNFRSTVKKWDRNLSPIKSYYISLHIVIGRYIWLNGRFAYIIWPWTIMRQEKIWKIPTSNKPNVLYGRISHTWHENLSSYQVSTFINAFLTCAKICLIFYMASASTYSSNWTEYHLVVKRVVPETRAYFGYIHKLSETQVIGYTHKI